jgi:hypothetical protein
MCALSEDGTFGVAEARMEFLVVITDVPIMLVLRRF